MVACNEIGQPPELEKRVTISRGDDFALRMVFKDAAGAAINLSGWAFNVRCTKPGQTDVVFATAVDAPNGTLTATLTDAQTVTMAAGATPSDLAGRWILTVVGTDNAGLIRRYVRVWFFVLS
jgi:hypothetical protein